MHAVKVFEKNARTPELDTFLQEKFKDLQAQTERKQVVKPLKQFTAFIRSGFIDKNKLQKNPNEIFDLLGLDKGLKNFKFTG